MSSVIEVSIGRVAPTTKVNTALDLHEFPLWSVAASNGFYTKDGGSVGTSPKYLDVLFYSNKGDAWAESAYVLGKRPNESEAETARRKARSVHGGVKEAISMQLLGRMGLGRVEGEYNTAGTNLPGYDDPVVEQSNKSPEMLCVTAVEQFKTTHMGQKSNKFPHVVDGGVVVRTAEVVAEKAGYAEVQIYESDGSKGDKLWVKLQLVNDVFGYVAMVAGKTVISQNWPILGEICAELLPEEAPGTIHLPKALRLLAACSIFTADELAPMQGKPQELFSGKLVVWLTRFEDVVKDVAPTRTLLAWAKANAEAEHKRLDVWHIAAGLSHYLAEQVQTPDATQLASVRRVQFGGASVVPMRQLDTGEGVSARPAAAATPAAAPTAAGVVAPAALAGLAQSAGEAAGVLGSCVFSLLFFDAASSLAEYDNFMRMSTLKTMGAMMRESTLGSAAGLDNSSRRTAAAALDTYFQTNITMGASELRAMLPARADGAAGMDHQLLLSTFRAVVDNANFNKTLSSADGGGRGAQQQVVVRVGGTNFLDSADDTNRAEFASLARDASEVVASGTLRAQLNKLEGYSTASDYPGLHNVLNGVGAPLQRILSTPAVSELSKVISNAQWPDEMTQQVLMVRSSLERRIAVGVFGSAATDLDADQRKCFAHLRQGHLGRARPSLLVKGAGASTQADPLSFLLKLESGQQEAALCGAFLLMIAALQVAFPAQAATSMRFMGKVQRWIHEQRGAGASWTALSAWYAGLCKRADRRVEKVLQRTADTLSTLDTAWIGDAGADYNAAYNVARAPELAASAAAKQRESDEQKRPKRDRVTPPPKPKKKAASGKSGGGGGGSSSGGGGGGSCGGGGGGSSSGGGGSGGGGGGSGGGGGGGHGGHGGNGGNGGGGNGGGKQLLLTNKSGVGNSSGKTVADKSKHWMPGTEWNLTNIMESLCTELHEWNDMKPCPFHFISNKGCNRGKDCRWYH